MEHHHVEFVVINGIPGVLFPTPGAMKKMVRNHLPGLPSEYPEVYDLIEAVEERPNNKGFRRVVIARDHRVITGHLGVYLGTVLLKGKVSEDTALKEIKTSGPMDIVALEARLRKAIRKAKASAENLMGSFETAAPSEYTAEIEKVSEESLMDLAVRVNNACIEEEESDELMTLAVQVNNACIDEEYKLPSPIVLDMLYTFWPELAKSIVMGSHQ